MAALLPLFLLAAAVVKDPGADLRQSCAADSAAVATVPAGTAVTIRYSLSGQSLPCYKVTVDLPSGPRDGYLSPAAIGNLEEFDAARKKGGRVNPLEVMGAVRPSRPSGGSAESSTTVAQEATRLIDASQPGRALSLLEGELKQRRDPGLLALAGAAAWRGDDPKKALGYWRESLAIAPNPQLEDLYRRVEQEAAGDQSDHRIYGMRVLLRYEDTAVTQNAAREMAAVVDQEFARVSAKLGCSTSERIVAIAQSEEAYRKTTGAAEWSGGQYDGRIRVPVFDGSRVDPQLRKTLAHEIVHACLSMVGNWPAWFQEGVAQYVAGEETDAQTRAALDELAGRKALPRLSELGQNWGRLNAASARVAYALALRAIEVFEHDMSGYGLRNLVHNPDRLPQMTAEIERRLGL